VLKRVGTIIGLMSMCCVGMELENDLLQPFKISFDEKTEINCVLSNEYECYWVELSNGTTLEVKEKFETNSIEGFVIKIPSNVYISMQSAHEVYEYLRNEYAKRTCKKDKLMGYNIVYPSSLCPKLVSFLRKNIASKIINKVHLMNEDYFKPLDQKSPIKGSIYEADYDGTEKAKITANCTIKYSKGGLETNYYRSFLSKEGESGAAELTFEASKFMYDYLRSQHENRQSERLNLFLTKNDPLDVFVEVIPYGRKKDPSIQIATYTGHYIDSWTIIGHKRSDRVSGRQWNDSYYGFIEEKNNNCCEELSMEMAMKVYKHLQEKWEQREQKKSELQEKIKILPQPSIKSPGIKRFRDFKVENTK
jgi:hypothetical protein